MLSIVRIIILVIILGFFFTVSSVSSQEERPSFSEKIVFTTNAVSDSQILFQISVDGTGASYLTDLTGEYAKNIGGVDCSPDGFHILLSTASGIYKYDVVTNNLTEILRNGLYDNPAWSRIGNRLAFNAMMLDIFNNANNDIYVSNLDGSDVMRLTNNQYTDYYPTWSPDAQKIAFAYQEGTDTGIAIMNVDGSNQVRLTQTTADEFGPSWSPNGQLIAFGSNRDGLYNIYTIHPDGSNLVSLTSSSGNNIYPKWSSDGSQISFSSDRDGVGYQIYVMNADGSNERRVTVDTFFNNSDNFNNCWLKPVSTPILFASSRDGNWELYTMQPDSSGPTRLTNHPATDTAPAWSPDRSQIAFTSSRDGNYEIYTMNADW